MRPSVQVRGLERLLEPACQTAVELLRADYSAVVLTSRNGTRGRIAAESPIRNPLGASVLDTVGRLRASSSDAGAREVVLRPTRAIHSTGLPRDAPSLSAYWSLTSGRRLFGWLAVVFAGGRRRSLSGTDRALGSGLAAQVAESIRHFDRSVDLATVRRLSIQLGAPRTSKTRLLQQIVRSAVGLLRAKNGGIYEYDATRRSLALVADSGRPPRRVVGQSLDLGEGLAGRLVASKRSWAAVADYRKYGWRARNFDPASPFAAVLEAKLVWGGEPIGVLYVDDRLGRIFDADDARRLQLFADHASIALVEASRRERDNLAVRRAQSLAEAAGSILGSIGRSGVELPHVIVESAASLLNAEVAGLFLVEEGTRLVLTASSGHRAGHENIGTRIPITLDGGSLTGFIAATGQIFNAFGEKLTTHPARGARASAHLPSGHCAALLAVPLLSPRNAELLGLLKVENLRTIPQPSRGFSGEDEWVIRLLGQIAAAAIEDAGQIHEADGDVKIVAEAIDSRLIVTRVGWTVHQVRRLLGLIELQLSEFSDWAEGSSRIPPARIAMFRRLRAQAGDLVDATGLFLDLLKERRDARAGRTRVNDAVGAILRLSRTALEKAGIEVIRELGSELPEVRISKLELVEVLGNLISNAEWAMESASKKELRVTTSLTSDGRWVRIVVADTGRGVPNEIVDRLFSAGFTSREARGGQGLGLHTSKDLLEGTYGGRMLLGSHTVGKGATFDILLPALAPNEKK